ncbi:hypothetical protein FHG87_022225, partial [Trinorchestia longiramus]
LFTDRSFFSATSLAISTSTPVTFPATPPATSRTTHPAVHPFVVPATMQYSQLILAVLLLTSVRAALNSRRARQLTVSANTGLLQARGQSPSAAAGQQSAAAGQQSAAAGQQSAAAGQQSAAAGQQSAAAGRQFNFKIRHSRAAHSTSSKSHQRRGSSVDFNTDQRPIVPLTGKSDRPTGYLMKRRSLDRNQRNRQTARTEYHVTLLFNGRCSKIYRADLKTVSHSLRKMMRQVHRKLAFEARIVSFVCIHQLRLNISLPLIRGKRVLYAELLLFRDYNFTIAGEEFAFHSLLSDKNNPIVEKSDPHDSSQKFIFIGLVLVGLAVLSVVVSMVVAECFLCVRHLILPPPLLNLSRYSEDEVPRCMKDDIKKRGKVHKVPNVYAVPGFLDTIHQESEKPIGIQNSAVSGDTGKNFDLQSDDEISSDWSTEVEYPRYQNETPVYSSVKRPASCLKTTGTEAQTNNVETQKLNNYAKYDTAGVDLESSCVPLYQCQTLNADYEQVAYDSDDGSEISLAEESYFLTHVNNGHDGRLKLETDM